MLRSRNALLVRRWPCCAPRRGRLRRAGRRELALGAEGRDAAGAGAGAGAALTAAAAGPRPEAVLVRAVDPGARHLEGRDLPREPRRHRPPAAQKGPACLRFYEAGSGRCA